MRNKNSDEKVSLVNTVNQSQRVSCIQEAELLYALTWLVAINWRGVMMNWHELLKNVTNKNPAVIPLNTFHFHLVSTYENHLDQYGGTEGC